MFAGNALINRYPPLKKELIRICVKCQNRGLRITTPYVQHELRKVIPSKYIPSNSAMDNILHFMGFRLPMVRRNERIE